jgi:hypothetical protein
MTVSAQNMADYTNSWEGNIEHNKTFNFSIEITGLQSEDALFSISNERKIIELPFELGENKLIRVHLGDELSFEGSLSENRIEINGFIKSDMLLYHVKLSKTTTNSFIGTWNILMVD